MAQYTDMSASQLGEVLAGLEREYAASKEKGLKLDLSRGKPDGEQLSLSHGLLNCISPDDSLLAEDGSDCRNYGGLEGIPEARRLMGDMLGVPAGQVLVGGNSSLNLMHDCISVAFVHGMPGCDPWYKQGRVKFLCPSPGYDRHFAVTEHFGIELIPVPMTATGPDMDAVERLVRDESVKGIWNVPKYSNPTGVTYSDETVRRMANLSPAAGDFIIMWDNAYAEHHLDPDHPDQLLNLLEELRKNGKEHMGLMFTSTSKITFAGAGIAAMAASEENLLYFKKHFGLQTIGYDKVNQLRHVRYFGDIASLRQHMRGHAKLLRPKFQAVLDALESNLGGLGIAGWEKPNGGYFISLDLPAGCAKRTVQLCKEAGVVMTPAGATYPYGVDPEDRNIRIAPTYATLPEVEEAASLLCLCARIAAVEKLLAGDVSNQAS